VKISKSRRKRSSKWRLCGKNVELKFWLCDPQKAHPCAESRLLTYFASKIRVDDLKNPPPKKRKNSRVNLLMREVAHAQKRNPLSDLEEILQHGRCPRPNHLCKIWWRSVKGCGVGGLFGEGGQILPFPIDFDRRPYNILALPWNRGTDDWTIFIFLFARRRMLRVHTF